MRDVDVPIPGGKLSVWHRPASRGKSTALLVHGLTGNSRWWVRVLDQLPPGIGVVAPDLRGRGGSVGAPPPFQLATLADDLARALDHFEIDRAMVAGYSMGAWIAAIFAERHPDRAERLLLLDGGLAIPGEPGGDADQIIQALVGPALARLEVEFDDEEACLEYWRAHPAFRRHWEEGMSSALTHELIASANGLRVSIDPEAIEVAARQITVDPSTRDVAAAVRLPSVLVVVERGTADQLGGMIPRQLADRASADNPHLRVRYLEGLNHYTLVLGEGAPTVASLIADAG